MPYVNKVYAFSTNSSSHFVFVALLVLGLITNAYIIVLHTMLLSTDSYGNKVADTSCALLIVFHASQKL